MSLRRALDTLPHDRTTQAVARDAVALFSRHADEWIGLSDVQGVLDAPTTVIDAVLDTLARSFVLDFDDAQSRYRYRPDRFTEIEIERYLRRAERHDGHVRSSVARYRQRYSHP